MNYEISEKIGKIKITKGFDSDIKFFFRVSKLHGVEIAFLGRLLSIELTKK